MILRFQSNEKFTSVSPYFAEKGKESKVPEFVENQRSPRPTAPGRIRNLL